MIGRLFNGLAAILGAAGTAQFPEFYRQYLQRLGGRLDQTHDDLQRLLADAQALGRSLEAYLEELMASGSEVARQTAARELARIDQAETLQQAYYALREATPLERPVVLARHLDPAIAESTLEAFQPAMPVSPEGFVYAGVGMLLGLLLLAGGERGGKAVGRGVKRRMARDRPLAPATDWPRSSDWPQSERSEPRRPALVAEAPARDDADAADPPLFKPRATRAEPPEARREPSVRFGGERGRG